MFRNLLSSTHAGFRRNVASFKTRARQLLGIAAISGALFATLSSGLHAADSLLPDLASGTWGTGKGVTLEEEDGKRFLRMVSDEAGKTIMIYREVSIPAGVEALELTWSQRITGLKPGKQSWFDARIMMDFMDASGNKVPGGPSAPYARKDTVDWESKSAKFLVPPGATVLKFMPSLFQVEAGTYDLCDFSLKPTEAAPLREAAEKAAAERAAKNAEKMAARQLKAAETFAANGNLIANGDFEVDDGKGGLGATWGAAKEGMSREEEAGNHFLRLRSTEPGKLVMIYRELDIPADAKALELTYRWRVTDLKPGEMPWFDARIMMDIKDASGKKLKPQPSPPYRRGNTKDGGWEEKSVSFLVPEGGVSIEFMPSLFNVKAGTLDIDDIVFKPTDPAPILAKQKEREAIAAKSRVPFEEPNKAKWPVEIKAQGNRLVTVEGGKEVWLQGLNVPSLEWSQQGEQVHKSVVVGIEEWKGNVIRLPVKDEYWFGKGATDGGKAYRDIVDQAITLASNRGAYVVLDLHRYRAPRKEYLDFWKDAATRYKNHPALIFDLINEPHGVSWEVWRDGGFVEEKKKDGDEDAFLTPEEKLHNKHGFQSPGMQAMLDTVRATGAKNMVLVGGLDYAYQLDGIVNGFGLKDPDGNGIIYACHIYPWKSKWQKYLLDAAAIHPILLGEVGADAKKMTFMPLEQQEDWETWVPDILGLIQQHKLNWTGWCFHPSASPRMLVDWNYTPTPFWGQQAKEALAGKQFPPPTRLR